MGKEDRAIARQRNSDQRRLGWGEGKSRDRAVLRSTTGCSDLACKLACVDIRRAIVRGSRVRPTVRCLRVYNPAYDLAGIGSKQRCEELRCDGRVIWFEEVWTRGEGMRTARSGCFYLFLCMGESRMPGCCTSAEDICRRAGGNSGTKRVRNGACVSRGRGLARDAFVLSSLPPSSRSPFGRSKNPLPL